MKTDKWHKGGDFGDFSGWIAYTIPNANCPVRIDQYENGEKTDGASVFDFVKGHSEGLKKMMTIFSKFRFRQSTLRINTRSDGFEENGTDGSDNWDFANNPNAYQHIGVIAGYDFWIYSSPGEENQLFYDSDRDGLPDTVWLNPAEITPDYNDPDITDPFPDYEYPWTNQPDPGTGGSRGGSGGGNYNPPVPLEIAPYAKTIQEFPHDRRQLGTYRKHAP